MSNWWLEVTGSKEIEIEGQTIHYVRATLHVDLASMEVGLLDCDTEEALMSDLIVGPEATIVPDAGVLSGDDRITEEAAEIADVDCGD